MSIFDKYLKNRFLHTEDSGNALPVATWEEDFSVSLGDFTTSGNAVWTRVTDDGNGDLFSARSGNISDKQISILQLVKDTTQESTLLKYDYKTSSEGDYDFLMVMVDNVIVKKYSGSIPWTTDKIWLHGIGSKTIKFIYGKDNSDYGGTDQVWIDNVGLYNVTESAISNTQTLFKKDVTVNGDLAVTNGNVFLGKTNITEYTNVYNTNGYRTILTEATAGGGTIRIWNELGVLGFTTRMNNTGSVIQLNNYVNGNHVFSVGTDTTPGLSGGYLQMSETNAKIRFGEFAGSDPTKMLVVNGESIFRGQVDVNGTISANPATVANQVVIKEQLDLKSDLESPTFTGTPTAPTAPVGTTGNQIATMGALYAATTTELAYALADETANLTVSTRIKFRMPHAMTLSEVRISLNDAPTISSVIVDVKENGVSIFSTLLSIDANEKTSVTAATPAVISDINLADDAEITVSTTQIGSGDTGKGLKILFKGRKA